MTLQPLTRKSYFQELKKYISAMNYKTTLSLDKFSQLTAINFLLKSVKYLIENLRILNKILKQQTNQLTNTLIIKTT